jgi:hypothetical protein
VALAGIVAAVAVIMALGGLMIVRPRLDPA